jgi:hypothetical protein
MTSHRRELTSDEKHILTIIQDSFGRTQNTEDDVFFTANDEAVIFVKASDGSSPVMANLTKLAAFRADGTISSEEDLKRDWLNTRLRSPPAQRLSRRRSNLRCAAIRSAVVQQSG